jgi:hypothetical protein
MSRSIPILPADSPCGRVAGGMSGIAPRPFPATPCLRTFFVPLNVGTLGGGQFPQLDSHRSPGKHAGHQGSSCRTFCSGCLGQAFSWSAHDISSPSMVGAGGTHGLILRSRLACTCPSSTTCLLAHGAGGNAPRKCGTDVLRRAFRSDVFSDSAPCTFLNRTSGESESQASRRHTPSRDGLPQNTSISYGTA